MSKFIVEFQTDTEAFQIDMFGEIQYVLRDIADRIDDGDVEGKVSDEDGNIIGTFNLIIPESS
jgi:hypothetical protein